MRRITDTTEIPSCLEIFLLMSSRSESVKKFHLTERGPASCTASKRPCPYGGKSGNENHFSDLKIAETAFATLMVVIFQQ